MFVSLEGTQTWRLHTKLDQFGWNISPNISRKKNYTDLILCKVFYMVEIYHMPDSWIRLLSAFDFNFYHVSCENQ